MGHSKTVLCSSLLEHRKNVLRMEIAAFNVIFGKVLANSGRNLIPQHRIKCSGFLSNVQNKIDCEEHLLVQNVLLESSD